MSAAKKSTNEWAPLWRPEQPDSEELVDLGDGQQVPRRFQMPMYAAPGSRVHLLITVLMVDTKAKVAEVKIDPHRDVEALDVADLAGINWPKALQAVVQIKALMVGGWLELSSGAEIDAVWDAHMQRSREQLGKAERRARASVRRNGVTPTDLAEIARLVEAEGVSGAVEKTGKSRSYIYKLLARAEKELS